MTHSWNRLSFKSHIQMNSISSMKITSICVGWLARWNIKGTIIVLRNDKLIQTHLKSIETECSDSLIISGLIENKYTLLRAIVRENWGFCPKFGKCDLTDFAHSKYPKNKQLSWNFRFFSLTVAMVTQTLLPRSRIMVFA